MFEMLEPKESLQAQRWHQLVRPRLTFSTVLEAQWQESSCQSRRCRLDPWVAKSPWRRKWKPTPVFLPGKSHAQRCLVGCSPWGCKTIGHDLTTKQHHQQLCSWSPGYKQIPLSVSAGPTGAGGPQVRGGGAPRVVF